MVVPQKPNNIMNRRYSTNPNKGKPSNIINILNSINPDRRTDGDRFADFPLKNLASTLIASLSSIYQLGFHHFSGCSLSKCILKTGETF